MQATLGSPTNIAILVVDDDDVTRSLTVAALAARKRAESLANVDSSTPGWNRSLQYLGGFGSGAPCAYRFR